MSSFFYLVRDCALALILIPPLMIWGCLSTKIRPTLAQRFGVAGWKELSRDAQWIWIHGASVGEIAGVEPLIRELKQAQPKRQILVTTTSSTGRKKAESIEQVSAALVLPFDLALLYRHATKGLRISELIVLETELWPSLFAFAKFRKIPLILVNARISDETIQGYQRFGWFFARVLSAVNMIFAQTVIDQQRFISLGADKDKVLLNGSTKFDISYPSRAELRSQFCDQYGVRQGDLVLTFGCLRREEEQGVISVVEKLLKQFSLLRIIIVPRHPERFEEVCKELTKRDIAFARRSSVLAMQQERVLVVDLMGELAAAYAMADLAVVCGTFSDAGGHNPVEAAAVGASVIIGPSDYNIRTPVEHLLNEGALTMVADYQQLHQEISEKIVDEGSLRAAGRAAEAAVSKLRGATARVMQYLRTNYDN